MITMAQRIEALRVEKGLSRPQLSAALGLPRSAMEKFETGRQIAYPGSAEEAGGYSVSLCSTFAGRATTVPGMESWAQRRGG